MDEEDEPRYWFPAKKFGWGWGPPRTWQGWLVLVAYVLLVVGAIPVLRPGQAPLKFIGFSLLLTLILIAICWMKGEPPRWRSGFAGRR